MPKQINVTEEVLPVLLSVQTQKLSIALEAQAEALHGLVHALQDYNDWLQEQIVRMAGEK